MHSYSCCGISALEDVCAFQLAVEGFEIVPAHGESVSDVTKA